MSQYSICPVLRVSYQYNHLNVLSSSGVWFNSRHVGSNQAPIVASLASLNMSANIEKLWEWRIHLIWCTWCFLNGTEDQAATIYIWTADRSSRSFLSAPQIASVSAKRYISQAHLELHPVDRLLLCRPVLPLIYSTSCYIHPYLHYSIFPTSLRQSWNLRPARWGITIHRRIEKHTLREHVHMHSWKQLIIIADRMLVPPTQHCGIVLEIANVRAMIVMKQDDDTTNQEISNDESEDPRESTWSSDIEDNDLDNWQEVLHPDLAHRDKTIWSKGVPLPTTQSHADTIITRTPLPNLWHSARVIAPPLLKRQKSAINISHESDIVQVLPLPKPGGDRNVPQPTACGDLHVAQHQNATFEGAKWFIEAIIFTKTSWLIISDEKYLMVDKPCNLAIEAQACQWALAGAEVVAPSVCQLPGGPSSKINPHNWKAVRVYSVSCYSIGHILLLNLETYIVKTKDYHHSRAFGRWGSSNIGPHLPDVVRIREGASIWSCRAPVWWCLFLEGHGW